MGPSVALSTHNGNLAPSSIKIASGLKATVFSGIGADVLSAVNRSKSAFIAAPFLEKISQVVSTFKTVASSWYTSNVSISIS